jgi:hypothetical protein
MEVNNTKNDWQDLTSLTQGEPILVEKVRVISKNITLEGSFELPQLAKLNSEDQVFIIAFVKSEGSIKEMEQIFGVSYPTIKSRLGRIAKALEFVETNPRPSNSEVLSRLQKGDINVEQALKELETLK